MLTDQTEQDLKLEEFPTQQELRALFKGALYKLTKKLPETSYKKLYADERDDFLCDKNYSTNQLASSELLIKFEEPMFIVTVEFDDEKVKYLKIVSLEGKPQETLILDKTGVIEVNSLVYGLIIPNPFSDIHIYGRSLDFFSDNDSFKEFSSALFESQEKVREIIQDLKRATFNNNLVYENAVKSLDFVKKEIQNLEEEKRIIVGDIKSSNAHANDLDKKVNDKAVEYEELVKEFEKVSNNYSSISRYHSELKVEIENDKGRLEESDNAIKKKQKELISLNKELNDLKNNKDVISLDTEGFNKASRNVLNKYYFALASVFIAFIALAVYMFSSAFDYIDISQSYNRLSAFDLFISRLPMTAATMVILGGFSALVIILMKNIIQINRERINILKASIMARHIGDSLPAEISREDRETLVTSTKLDLIMRLLQENTNQNSTSSADQVIEILKATQSNNQ
ncbi:hypothetical protein ABMY35_09860 [Pseudoalteromonas sp. BZB3]|uniref:hypothetical protein n=1 Tax=Pseudoalteromonas sp. BZB3 TaxID=3136670 RepID=UPI0032C4B242